MKARRVGRDFYAGHDQHLPDAVGYAIQCCGWTMRTAAAAVTFPDGKRIEQDGVVQTTENTYVCEYCGSELSLRLSEKRGMCIDFTERAGESSAAAKYTEAGSVKAANLCAGLADPAVYASKA